MGAVSGGPAVEVKQVALGTHPKGRYLQWFYHDENGIIKPGDSLAGFGVDSALLPGFTTAWFASGRLIDYDRSWPEEIFRQLEPLEDRQWREVWLPVVGPAFNPDDSTASIASNFLRGIQAWIDHGTLNPRSAFVRAAQDEIAYAANPERRAQPFSTSPSSAAEHLLATAMRLSLHLDVQPR